MEKKAFKKGEIICKEGYTGTEMYIILSGRVEVYKTLNGEKIHLSYLKEKDFVGEIRLLLGKFRTASVVADEDTEVMVLNQVDLVHKIQQDPKFAIKMLTLMAQKVVEAHEVIARLEGEKKSMEIMFKN